MNAESALESLFHHVRVMSSSDIIVGIDFSDASRAAAKEAGHIANLRDTSLHLVHVIDLEFFEHAIDEKFLTLDSLKNQAEEALRKLALEAIDRPPPLQFHVLVGHPFEELATIFNALQCDLLVLGSYGNRSSQDETGTTATRFVRKSVLPVLLVRDIQRVPFKTIVACHDFSPTSQKALEYAVEVALAHQAEMHILHIQVSEIPPYYWTFDVPTFPETYFAEVREKQLQQLEILKAEFLKKRPALDIVVAVRGGESSAKEIINYVNTVNADLTVLGTRGRNGVKSLLLGTTAEKVVHNCPSSILAVKPEQTS